MRHVLIAVASLLAVSVAGVQPGAAQSKGPKPWCIADGAYGPGSMDCTYWNYRQCYDSSRGAGGTCVENPVILWQRWQSGHRQGQQSSNRGGY